MMDLLRHLTNVTPSGDNWTARCPAHQDKQNSLSVARPNGKWLLKCHAGCSADDIVKALGLTLADLFDRSRGRGEGVFTPPNSGATVQGSAGLTLQQYADAKRLPVEFLKSAGLSDISYDGRPAVRMPYYGPTGELLAVRFRISRTGDRFRWKSGTKPALYGLNRLDQAREAGHVFLVEGESDCQTLWFHNLPALGVPGAANWREDRDAHHLDGINEIYIVIEPDRGGEAVRKWLSQSTIRHRAKLLTLPAKDISALHLDNPAEVKGRLQIAMLGAVPWTVTEAKAEAETRGEAWSSCASLARCPDILSEVDNVLGRLGLVGERAAAKLVFLAVTSRLLDRPVSIALKGPSSGGKSFLAETVLKLFPPEAFYALSAMSDRALAYSTEPLKHRHLVIYEAAGMAGDFATYLMRSLMSEGRIRYETVEKTKDGLAPRLIEREGPTGLIITTTRLTLHPENETRLLSITVTDTQDQTSAVLLALAEGIERKIDLEPWHAMQTWLATGTKEVVIPFATKLAGLVPPVAVRLRRDFRTVLQLIRAHALLHQASRRQDDQGRIVAQVEDYAVVRKLVADLVAAGVEVNVPKEMRETVKAVNHLLQQGKSEVSLSDLMAPLRLDRGTVSRRVAAAVARGFLKNLEDRKGRPARLVLADPLPEDVPVLPDPDVLHHCAVAGGDRVSPSPPPSTGHVDAALRCDHCGQSGDVIEVHDTAGSRWLHRACVEVWDSRDKRHN